MYKKENKRPSIFIDNLMTNIVRSHLYTRLKTPSKRGVASTFFADEIKNNHFSPSNVERRNDNF